MDPIIQIDANFIEENTVFSELIEELKNGLILR